MAMRMSSTAAIQYARRAKPIPRYLFVTGKPGGLPCVVPLTLIKPHTRGPHMDVDVSVETGERRLNQWVGMTVLVLSVLMGMAHIKDDNIVQAMQQAKMGALDTWNEYQSTRIKRHQLENSDLLISALPSTPQTQQVHAELAEQMAHYDKEVPALKQSAQTQDAMYDKLNYRDDQFDLADALLSMAIALAGVTALTHLRWLMVASWVFGVGGGTFVAAAFGGWPLHPDWIIALLT